MTKNVPYNFNCYTINELSSNHLPVFLKFKRVNISKKDLVTFRTDWSVFLNKSDKWRIDYNLRDPVAIDSCITEL